MSRQGIMEVQESHRNPYSSAKIFLPGEYDNIHPGAPIRLRLTAKERILLYLLELSKLDTALEVPPELAQEGVARGSKVDLRHLPQYIRPLIHDELVTERRAHVRGIRQRRKVYGLTEAGVRSAIRLSERLKLELVRVKDESGIREATVVELLESTGGRVPLSRLVIEATGSGTIDLSHLEARSRTAYVEMMADAPRTERFVGRREEIQSVLEQPGGVLVVRGVAGIGKSSLAARVCELERGKRNIFWHRIRSWDTDQTMFAVLADFLQLLNRPGLGSVLKRGEINRAAEVLRADLPGIQSLLVFDDAHEAGVGVLSFLRLLTDAIEQAPDVRVIVLSRRAVPFYDRRHVVIDKVVREMSLGGLSSEEVIALLSDEPKEDALLALSHRLRGHPLFLQLARALYRAGTPSQVPRTVGQFIAEQVYGGLTDAERTMMKTASLYRVPVPREALFSAPSLSVDTLLSLVDKSLLGRTGESEFTMHDTIHDFFAGILTPDEKERLGWFAVLQLRELASVARNAGEYPACVDYLSNALELPMPAGERPAILESLGDSSEKLGDIAGSLIAYKSAAKISDRREMLVRIHRKCAAVLENHGDYGSAQNEIDAAEHVQGPVDEVDRGWLDLIRCRIAVNKEQFDEAARTGEAALRAFQLSGDLAGQGESLLELGKFDYARGGPAPRASHLESALVLANSLRDAELASRVHIAMSKYAMDHEGNLEKAEQHLAAVEGILGALKNPQIACRFHVERGFFRCMGRADQEGAAEDFTRALRLSQKFHDRLTAEDAKFGLACVNSFLERFDDARRDFERVAVEFRGNGLDEAAVNAEFWAATHFVWLDDLERFGNAVDKLPRHGVYLALRGMDFLIQGDGDRCLATIAKAEELARPAPSTSSYPDFDLNALPVILLFHGTALRVLGRDLESDDLIRRALAGIASTHNNGLLGLAPKLVSRWTDVLGRAYRKSVRGG